MPSEKDRLDALVATTSQLLGDNAEVKALRSKVEAREKRELAQLQASTNGETTPDGAT